MELLAQIPIIGGTLAVVVPFLAVLSVVVFVHEFGHYIVGRWCGIGAEVFSIGFGKPLWKWTDRRGTRWQVAALPLGGYVRFVGDMDPASAGRGDDESLTPEERESAFHNAGLLRRTLTVAAGPVANFLLSVVIFTGIVLFVGQPSSEPVIGSLGTEAVDNVGFEAGDRVLSIAGKEIVDFGDIINIMARTNGEPQSAMIERGGDTRQITVRYHRAPRIQEVTPGMPAARAGLMSGDVFVSIDGEPVESYRELQLITADKPHGADTSQLGGPIRIAEISGDAAQKGLSSIVWLIAVLSTSIGLINLFPIPILDGGHLMFYALELVRGRPVGAAWMRVGTMIGLSLVLLLMVFATYNDIVRL